MGSFDFQQKNRKALVVVGGLMLVCISIALLTWTAGREGVEQQTEQSVELGTEPTEVPVTEPPAEPTEKPEPTVEPEPTEESELVLTEEYELIYEGINIFNHLSNYTYLKYTDTYADLYMRRQRDDTGEYIELSLWSEEKEIWHTINRDYVENYPLFWQEDSENLTLEQGQCYYVVELDGIAYLMRYSVENTSNMVTMSYKVFGICPSDLSDFNGSEAPYDADSISLYLVSDSAIDLAVSFPIEQMTAFADTIKGYMENGHMVASTLHGVFEVATSAERDNPVSPYLYDIFPWIPELVAQHGVNMESIHSAKKLLTVLQNELPTSTSVTMPDVVADGNYFITGDYYSDSDKSYMTVRRKEDGSYEGTLLIDNLLSIDFAGDYDNGILTVTEIMDYLDELPYEMEISFKDSKATVTIIAAAEWSYAEVGYTLTLDRNEKPEEFEYLRNAEDYPVWE